MKKPSSRTIAIAATVAAGFVGLVALLWVAVMSLQNPSHTTPPASSLGPNTATITPSGTTKTPATTTTPVSSVSNPIYVTLNTHIEEPDDKHPDYTTDQTAFNELRAAYVELANLLHDEGVTFNFQSDWNFLMAEAKFDKGDNSTNGKNLVKWMHDDMGFSIDPHAHETEYNYADVAYLIKQLGVEPSNLVGGYIVYPPEDSKLEYLRKPITGNYYDYTWTPGILWGAGTYNHIQDDLVDASGVWRPKDSENYLVDDPNGTLPNVGSFGGGWSGLALLLNLQKAGKLEKGKIYATTITLAWNDITDDGYIDDTVKVNIEKYKEMAAEGKLIWATTQTVVADWKSKYNSEPNILTKTDAEALSGTATSGTSRPAKR